MNKVIKKIPLFSMAITCALVLSSMSNTSFAQNLWNPQKGTQMLQNEKLSIIIPDPLPFKLNTTNEALFKETVKTMGEKQIDKLYENRLCPSLHNVAGEQVQECQ